MRKRIFAAFVSLCLIVSMLPTMAFAEAGAPNSGIVISESGTCEHHTQHDESCGYTEGRAEIPCSHEHTEDCYTLVTECVHEHTAECYPAESVSENTATPSEPEEAEPTACTHQCSEESGCITKTLDCKHEHDEACGYVPATEGTPCTFVCEVCNGIEEPEELEECTCEILCTGENRNVDCPVCGAEGADVSDCKGAALAECICETLCAEGAVNPDCSVCGAEGADVSDCKGAALAECICETLCAEGAVNPDCPLCSTVENDFTVCKGVVPMMMSSRTAHSNHPLCGATCDGDCGGSHENVTWEVWNGQTVENGKSYYLENDVEGKSFIVPDGATVNLCLNGHTLTGNTSVTVSIRGAGATLNLCDCQSGNVITYGNIDETGLWTKSNTSGNCNLNGGVITGANVHGVKIYTNSNFNMYGGNIAGNTSTDSFAEKDGGGIYAEGSNRVSMHGGSITGNTAPEGNGGGLFLYNKGEFFMYGSSRIEGNKTRNGGGVYLESGSKSKIDGGYITNNTATENGGGVCLESGSESEIYGGYITNNTATENGGGVYLESGSKSEMDGGYITNNMATENGGGVCLESDSESEIYGGDITNNTATKNGGGVYVGQDAAVSLSTSASYDSISICDNTAQNGGGIYESESGAFELTSFFLDISNNKATNGNGGGIYFGSSKNHTIMSGNISGNTATGSGGGVYIGNGILTIGATMKKNSAYNGGGIYIGSDLTHSINGNISENTATGSGGGVYIGNGTLTINVNATMEKNSAINGGGIYIGSDSNHSIKGDISENTAAENGGGVCIGKGRLDLDATMKKNNAINGGGVYIGSDSTHSIYGDISENTATGSGGGVYIGNGILDLDATIEKNSAYNGGGIYIGSNSTHSIKGKISGNQASNQGGGLFINGSSTKLNQVEISGNKSLISGGGVYVINGSLTTENTKIINNEAQNDHQMVASTGGGVFLNNSVLTMNNSAISGNEANWRGGGVCTKGNSTIHLMDSHIGGENDAGNGGGVYTDGDLTITGSGNSSIAGNRAGNTGGGICVDMSAQLTLSGEIAITGNSANKSGGVYINEKNLLLSGKPNITGNTNGDLYLRNSGDGNTIVQLIGALEEGTKIGVTMNVPGTFVNNWKQYMDGKESSVYFEKNNGTGYHIGTDANGNPALIANSYRVQFEANGGEGTMESQSFAYDTSQKLSSNKFTYTGYGFANWNTKADGSGQSYTDGQIVNNLTDVNDGVVTLYAQWLPIYSVTLHANGGIIADGKEVSSYLHGVGAVLPASDDITRTGYTFGGWYDNEQCDGNAVTEITSEDVGNKVYWAKWIPNSYQVTVMVDPAEGGTVSGEGTYETDQIVTLTAIPNSKYRFSHWEIISGATTIQDNTFTMPAENVIIQAIFKRKSSNSSSFFWNLNFDTNGGSKIDTITEWEYSTIDLDEYVPEKEGYKFVGWYADKDLDKKIDEVYLTKDTTVYAKWEKIEEVPEEPEETEETEPISFKDVKESDWFYKAVSYAVENGLMSGMSEDIFAPNTPLTREMLAVVLYNVEGQPESTGMNPFTDVKADMWYTDAILWANENGIVAGYDNGVYGVGDLITREQFAVMLYRYAQFKGYDTTQGGMAVREFSDYENISDYARPAMAWAVNAGIMSGMDDGTLMPQGKTTRAEAATMLMNFCENIVN